MARGKDWDEYDQDIKNAVDEANARFRRTPGYVTLDWKIVKAIVWTEILGGPTIPAWKYRPMQMGNSGDTGWETLTEDKSIQKKDPTAMGKVHAIAPSDLKAEMLAKGRNDPQINIRAGVFWLCYKAARFKDATVDDSSAIQQYTLQNNEYPSTVWGKLKTTQDVIMHDSHLSDAAVRSLPPHFVIHFHLAHTASQISRWGTWDIAVHDYNGKGDDNYMPKFHANLHELSAPAPAAKPPVDSK